MNPATSSSNKTIDASIGGSGLAVDSDICASDSLVTVVVDRAGASANHFI
jgi:hypothetical protein